MTVETENTETPGAAEQAEAAGAARAAQASTDAWREAIATRKTQLAEGRVVPGAKASRVPAGSSRRRFIVGSFWGVLGASVLGSLGIFLDFFYPRGIAGFGGPVPAGKVSDFPPGAAPTHFLTGQFWVVNLDPNETRAGGSEGGSGLLALWHKCPHLGCAVPWRVGFNYYGTEGDRGWYRCPCHGSTYTKAGRRVFGPAPRSMDSMKIEVDEAGNVTVQTGEITNGGDDNWKRAGAPYWGGPVEDG